MTSRVKAPPIVNVISCASALLALSACSSLGGLETRVRAHSARPPANVVVYLKVGREHGAPELKAEDFTLFEDDHRLDPQITRQTLLDQNAVAYHQTLLLVDNSLATDEGVRAELKNAIVQFVEEVNPTQAVAVYAYDGSAKITPLALLPRSPGAKRSKPELRPLRPRDVSRNLNGALLLAGEQLDRLLSRSGKPVGVGTLVVFAAGADLAGRTDDAAVHDWLDATQHRVLAIGYGDQSSAVERFGKDGYYDAVGPDTLSLAFEDAGHAVAKEFDEGYLLSYCSPARGGARLLRVEVHAPSEEGELYGQDSVEFNAAGFRAGCDPTLLPRFRLKFDEANSD